jgi:hypothetical protein
MGVYPVNDTIEAAIEQIQTYGYCILEDRLPNHIAQCLAQRCLDLHDDPKCKPFIIGGQFYQTLFGMLNLDDRVWTCASDAEVVAIARHFLVSTPG